MENSSSEKRVRRFATLVRPSQLRSSDIGNLAESLVTKVANGQGGEETGRGGEEKSGEGVAPSSSVAVAVLENASSRHTSFSRRRLSLSKAAILVGRANCGRHRPADGNAFFECRVLSRSHAVLWHEEGRFYIKDLKSSNGTFVNGSRLPGEQRQELRSGDVIQFGQDVFDSVDKHHCIVAKVALYRHGQRCEEEGAAREGEERTENDCGDREALSALQGCLKEMSAREANIAKKLTESSKVIERVKGVVDEQWEHGMEEDVLLSKISLLREVLREEGGGRVGDTDKRLKFEENMKRMLYESSRAKVAAELRAFRAEEGERAMRKEGRKSGEGEGEGQGRDSKEKAVEDVASQTEGEEEEEEAKRDFPDADGERLSKSSRVREVLDEIRVLHRELQLNSDCAGRVRRLEAALSGSVACQRGTSRAVMWLATFFVALAIARFMEMTSKRTVAPLEVW